MAAGLGIWAPVHGQQPTKVFRVGVVFYRIPLADLTGPTPAFPGARVFRDTLRELGWVEGKNAEILWRSALGDNERVPAIVQELLDAKVDILALSGNNLIQPAIQKTRRIPIVMIQSNAPVEAGLVASLARPGGNVTGMVGENRGDLNAKRLEILKQTVPHASKVAFFHERAATETEGGAGPELQAAARSLGLTLLPFAVDTQGEFHEALRDAVRQGANALFVSTSLAAAQKDQLAIHALAERHKLPAMHRFLNAARSGGLISYGYDSTEQYRRTAFFVDKILRGTKPASMPVEQPTSFRLILNMKAARAIGLIFPPSVVAQANEIIE